MSIQEKLNKVLEFLVNNKERQNVNPHTIRESIFHGEINLAEARVLHQELLISGKTRVIGQKFLAYSAQTEIFLDGGGYGGLYKKEGSSVGMNDDRPQNRANADESLRTPHIAASQPETAADLKFITAFVTYAWGNLNHEDKVLRLTAFLRQNGIAADMDKLISQQQTAINFKQMMVTAMQFDKVIVVLSKNYKERADIFSGGVGTEFRYMLSDIDDHPNKYIFVTFDGRNKEVIPNALKMYDVVDLSAPGWEEVLIRKITGEQKFIIPAVTGQPPVFGSEKITGEFNPVDPAKVISIEDPQVRRSDSMMAAGLYRQVNFKVNLNFKNISGKTIPGFAYTVTVKPGAVDKEDQKFSIQDGNAVISDNIERKTFPDMVTSSNTLSFKIQSHTVRQVVGSTISVTVFTDYGAITREFPIEQLFKIHSQPVYQSSALVPLNPELFGERF